MNNLARAKHKIALIDRLNPFKNILSDNHNRFHDYLRISLTERCNLRCKYCMPKNGVKLSLAKNILSAEEITRIAKLFVLHGVKKIRLTGGEPTVRRDFMQIVENLNSLRPLGLKTLSITTNGLALQRKLPNLKKFGLDQINISLDTLDPSKFESITRRPGHHAVLEAISAAVEQDFEVKVNVVVMKNVNENEIFDFIKMTKDLNVYVRFIEFMPFGGNEWNVGKIIPTTDLLKDIESRYQVEKCLDESNDTSKAYKISGHRGKFGFISSMTDHFCGTCNRLRILADGNMKVCLFGNAETSLRDIMRHTDDNSILEEVIKKAILGKNARHAGIQDLFKLPNRPMILIGG